MGDIAFAVGGADLIELRSLSPVRPKNFQGSAQAARLLAETEHGIG